MLTRGLGEDGALPGAHERAAALLGAGAGHPPRIVAAPRQLQGRQRAAVVGEGADGARVRVDPAVLGKPAGRGLRR